LTPFWSPGRGSPREPSTSIIEAMGWDDAEAAAQLLAAMTREVSALEFDAGRRRPASRLALKRFLGI